MTRRYDGVHWELDRLPASLGSKSLDKAEQRTVCRAFGIVASFLEVGSSVALQLCFFLGSGFIEIFSTVFGNLFGTLGDQEIIV